MRHERLKLVVPEDRAAATRPTGLSAVTEGPDPGILLLRLAEADDGALPDDAA
jgi:hypothetical protein